MKLDLGALRGIERERDVPFETLVEAIETALLTAYQHTSGAQPHARVHVDRKSGAVAVHARELDADGQLLREWDDTPEGFGRIATMTAKQVILQRLREVEQEATYGEYAGREGDVVSGTVQQHERRAGSRLVMVDLGKVEAVLPPAEQVPGESYAHGLRLKCFVVAVHMTARGPSVMVSRTPSGAGEGAVRAGGARDRRRDGADRRDRPGGRPPDEDRGSVEDAGGQPQRCLHRPDGRPGSGRDERAQRREDRHRRLVGRPCEACRRTRSPRPGW